MKNPKNILAISTTGIGNLILYTPVLKTLRSWYKDAHITLLCGNKEAAELVMSAPYVDDVWMIDKSSILSYFKILAKARGCGFDLVVTSFLDKSMKVGLFVKMLKAKDRLGYDTGLEKAFYNYRALISEKLHEVDYNLSLLSAYDEGPLVKEPEIVMDDNAVRSVSNNFETDDIVIGIHPGSGEGADGMVLKRMPTEIFAKAADRLVDNLGVKIAIFGGPDEKRLSNTMIGYMKNDAMVYTGKLSISETAALISKCRVFLSNDSGLMHISAAVGTPVVAVFGPTLYWKNHPYNIDHILIRKDLECAPCYNYKNIGCNDNRCLSEITPDEVYNAVVELNNRI